jgi:hypothetical protein
VSILNKQLHLMQVLRLCYFPSSHAKKTVQDCHTLLKRILNSDLGQSGAEINVAGDGKFRSPRQRRSGWRHRFPVLKWTDFYSVSLHMKDHVISYCHDRVCSISLHSILVSMALFVSKLIFYCRFLARE